MHLTPAQRLETHILTHTLTLIASVLALPFLCWHISSAHLIDNYGMPVEWEEKFLRAQFQRWRVAIWVGMFGVIPLNCVHSLLAIDYYHACLHARGRPVGKYEGGADIEMTIVGPPGSEKDLSTSTEQTISPRRTMSTQRSRQPSTSSTADNTRTLTIPSTPHPIFHARLSPPVHLVVLTVFDILTLTILLFHITTFFTSIPSNRLHCRYIPSSPLVPTDRLKSGLSVRERCIRVNIDVHIAGGTGVAVCAVLAAFTLWALLFRLWEGLAVKRDGGGCGTPASVERVGGEGLGLGMVDGTMEREASVLVSSNTTMSHDTVYASDSERRLPSLRHGHAGERRLPATERIGESWNEMLLECLVP
ncbi:hypothetical protein BDV95DRAFT_666975 [Massariosphaeria phaeospora]|uniref:Uncharacterized protein n=1 Tax=Massariosphaeria phaeospora TaxID=100035 RepID=A0A7C8I7X1_9PLEO|nr:hypothetical protein BDV95DRAFT_666975 [Massariosphaeria phaeospora]